MRRLLSRTGGGWLTAALVALVLVVGAVQALNPHSYLSELVQRAGEGGFGPGATLTDLRGVDQLRDAFNAGSGHPRLVLLLSPT